MLHPLIRVVSAVDKTTVLLAVMCMNFVFIGIDVVMAHSQSGFFRWALIPIAYSVLAVLAVLLRLVLTSSAVVRRGFQVAMWSGALVGVTGTLFHLTGNSSSGRVSFHQLLVEGSPVAAPIAFAGIAAFALTSEGSRGTARRSRLLVLVGLGFMGAVVAAFLDHARLSYTPGYTLIPLVPGALAAISCFYVALGRPSVSETRIFLSLMALSAVVGLAGFVFHVLGDLEGTQSIVWSRFLYRNPVLGPLLFLNLAMLGALSILPEPKPAISADDRQHVEVALAGAP